MAVDKQARDFYIQVIKEFLRGTIDDKEVFRRIDTCSRSVVGDRVIDELWSHLSIGLSDPFRWSFKIHNSRNPQEMSRHLETIVLFLSSDLEYEWETPPGYIAQLRSFLKRLITRQPADKKRTVMAIGDETAWPFFCMSDLEREKAQAEPNKV